jgi:hypothetical protein
MNLKLEASRTQDRPSIALNGDIKDTKVYPAKR